MGLHDRHFSRPAPGRFTVTASGETDTIAVFDAKEVDLAEIYEYGQLKNIVTGGRRQVKPDA